MALELRRVANPVQPILALVNGPQKQKGRNMAATRKRSTKRRSSTRNPRSKTRAIKKSTTRAGKAITRTTKRRSNPVYARSHRHRHHRSGRRRNPVGTGVVSEAFNYSIAGFAVAAASPIVNGFIGRFLPLGQFQQPVIFAATGFGLGWLAGIGPTFTKRLQRPLAVMGVALGITAILTPWVRKLFAGVGLNAGAGMSGYRDRYGRQMRGIAAVGGVPPNIMPLPAPAPTPAMTAPGMKGISAWGARY
jgi:hypothetical protein